MLFYDVWSENAALFERLMEIHSNPPILYYEDILQLFFFSFHSLTFFLGGGAGGSRGGREHIFI